MTDYSAVHPSMQFIPSGEIDRRIMSSSDDIRGEFRGAMEKIEQKVDHVASQLTLLVGTSETKGVLARIEDSIGQIAENQKETNEAFAASTAAFDARVVVDEKFRTQIMADVTTVKDQVEALKKEVAIFKVIIAISRSVISGIQKISASSWTMRIILGAVSWITGIQFFHVVVPFIKEFLAKHHL